MRNVLCSTLKLHQRVYKNIASQVAHTGVFVPKGLTLWRRRFAFRIAPGSTKSSIKGREKTLGPVTPIRGFPSE
jgi:hypothetical protein